MENVEKKELTASEKLAQLEKEKLSRRQALARFGFQAGAAAVAALTADELLRKVGTEMRKRAGDNKVAQQVAKEFSNAGVASALAVKKPGDEGFQPDVCITGPCIFNCYVNNAFTCVACTGLCFNAQEPKPRNCATELWTKELCHQCCEKQGVYCRQMNPYGASACDSIELGCKTACDAKQW